MRMFSTMNVQEQCYRTRPVRVRVRVCLREREKWLLAPSTGMYPQHLHECKEVAGHVIKRSSRQGLFVCNFIDFNVLT